MGLEPANATYTLHLTDWNTAAFERRGLNYVVVPGESLNDDNDAYSHSYYAMSQMMNLVRLLKAGELNKYDVIYFENMFHPGIESLPYILNKLSIDHRPKIYVRCLAQTIDPDDWTHQNNMREWMSHYEHLVNTFVTGIIAPNEEMVANMKVAGWKAPIYNVSGLPYDKQFVLNCVDNEIKPFAHRHMRVMFAGRWDSEKQPDFYMDFIEEWASRFGNNVEFVLSCGGPLRTNNMDLMERTFKLVDENKLVVHENLEKTSYYHLLNNSRVLFNCSLQDWTSNSLSEADSLGCNVLYPAYRSFPEAFSNDHTRLYVPWSIEDAITKIHDLLQRPHLKMGEISDYNNGTLDRIINILEGKGRFFNRDDKDYRKHVRHGKF